MTLRRIPNNITILSKELGIFQVHKTEGPHFRTNKLHVAVDRGSRPEVFCKKGILKNLTKFTGVFP